MTDPVTGEPCGVHRTFVKPDGSGKADVDPAKMILGRWGVIRLIPDEDVTLGLGITEGIENALSIMQHGPWSPVLAVGNSGSISNFPVLAGVESLTIFADHDLAGIAAAQNCARRWMLGGREANIIAPRRHGDWNDVARGAA